MYCTVLCCAVLYCTDGRFSLVMDLCNDLKFIFIFVLGYGITAADEHGMEEVVRRGRWLYLAAGNC